MFQSTPPRGGRRQGCLALSLSSYCFNPRPRVGGDYCRILIRRLLSVSIHAPAWGATLVAIYSKTCRVVSIHAPAWGATRNRPLYERALSGFNPRPRVGGDMLGTSSLRDIICFNPRPRVGGDILQAQRGISVMSFNPRPRVGGDDTPKVVSDTLNVSIHAPAWGAT